VTVICGDDTISAVRYMAYYPKLSGDFSGY